MDDDTVIIFTADHVIHYFLKLNDKNLFLQFVQGFHMHGFIKYNDLDGVGVENYLPVLFMLVPKSITSDGTYKKALFEN